MKEDCFSYIYTKYNNKGSCKLLKKADCETCRFYKSKTQWAKDRLKYMPKEKEFLMRSNPKIYTEYYFSKLIKTLKENL